MNDPRMNGDSRAIADLVGDATVFDTEAEAIQARARYVEQMDRDADYRVTRDMVIEWSNAADVLFTYRENIRC